MSQKNKNLLKIESTPSLSSNIHVYKVSTWLSHFLIFNGSIKGPKKEDLKNENEFTNVFIQTHYKTCAKI